MNPYLRALIVMAGVSLLCALVLGLATSVVPGYDPQGAVLLGAMTLTSVLIGVVSAVGALVLAGMRWMLSRAGLDV